MKELQLNAEAREIGTKGDLHKHRENGSIPAIVYGAKEKSIPVWVNEKDFTKVLHTELGENALIKLKVKNTSKTVLVNEIQRDVISEKPIHIDFHIVSLKKKIEVDVPLHATGEAPGVKVAGGILEHILREIHVSCLPTNIPESINIDVSNLNIGDSITVKDLPGIEGVEVLSDPESILVHITVPTVVEEEPAPAVEEMGPAEPEVISKGKKEEAGEEEETKKEKAQPEKKTPEKKTEEKK
jgi:large subunit ribosomal protein L25